MSNTNTVSLSHLIPRIDVHYHLILLNYLENIAQTILRLRIKIMLKHVVTGCSQTQLNVALVVASTILERHNVAVVPTLKML